MSAGTRQINWFLALADIDLALLDIIILLIVLT
jgi:hypothetical protein